MMSCLVQYSVIVTGNSTLPISLRGMMIIIIFCFSLLDASTKFKRVILNKQVFLELYLM